MSFSDQQFNLFERNIANAKQRTEAKKNPGAKNRRDWKRPQLQELQNADHPTSEGLSSMSDLSVEETGPADDVDQNRISKLDVEVRGRFRFHVSLKISGGQRRDPDGAMSTILDCMVKAVRQFATESPEAEAWARENLPFDDNFKFLPIQTCCVEIVSEHLAGATVFIEHVTESEIKKHQQTLEIL